MADTNENREGIDEQEERREYEEKFDAILRSENGVYKVLLGTLDQLDNRDKELAAAKEETASFKRKLDQTNIDLNKANDENRDNSTFKRKYDQTIIDLNKANEENKNNSTLLAACLIENNNLKAERDNLKAEIAKKRDTETASKKNTSTWWFPTWN